MNKVNLFFSAIGAIFGVLALTKTLSYDIALPVMYVSIGIVCLSRCVTEIRTGRRISAVIDFLLAIGFMMIVAIRFWRLVR